MAIDKSKPFMDTEIIGEAAAHCAGCRNQCADLCDSLKSQMKVLLAEGAIEGDTTEEFKASVESIVKTAETASKKFEALEAVVNKVCEVLGLSMNTATRNFEESGDALRAALMKSKNVGNK